MRTLLQDVRYALRGLAKSPGFTATAVLTLALGIGANTAIFGVIRSVLLEPLPYPDPGRLVTLQNNPSVPELSDLKAMTRSFTAMGGATPMSLDLTGGPEPVKVRAALFAGDLFEALGSRALLGRPLTREDDRKGGNAVVALSYGAWQRQWAGDPAIVGKSITLAGQPYTVVGVLAPNFRLPEIEADLFAPVRVVYPIAAESRGVHFLQTAFRLGPGVSPAAARADLAAAMSRLAVVHPDEDKGLTPDFLPLLDEIVGESRRPLWILAGAVGMVLLIACANLANLLLARAASRKTELAIRTALGAPRTRLVRQMLTESLVLAVAGGACGMLLAVWGTQLLIARMPSALPRLENVTVDGTVAVFTLLVSILTGLVFGIAPAWKASGARFAPGLAAARSQSGVGRSRLRDAFVVAEIALAMVLLVGAGLLMNALWRLQSVRPGFEPNGLVALRVDLPESRYGEIPAQTAFREQLLEQLNAAPGIRAAMVSEVPLSGDSLNHNFLIAGRPPVAVGDEPELYSRSIMGDYFRTIRVPLRAGRDFLPRDREGAPLVGIVNETFARTYFPGSSPLGARIRWARQEEPLWIEIVGVVGDVRHFGLSQDEMPAVYTPYAQSLQPWKRWMEVVVQGSGGSTGLAALVRQKVREADPLLPVGAARTLPEIVDSSLGRERFRAQLLSIFAALALLLASVGIAGVMGNSVRQRRTEIGVRLALGAAPGRVVGRLLREGARLTAVGLVLGLGASLLVSRVLTSFLFGVAATDPATYAGVAALLAAVAMLACYLPARRAAHVDPMTALRSE